MLKEKEISKLLSEIENQLLKAGRINIEFTRIWSSQFPTKAGVYVIYDKDKPVYVGETGNIRKRMSATRRTVNHTFRRSLGYALYGEKAPSKQKFSTSTENKLDEYYKAHITVGYYAVSFGRTETEEYIVDKYSNQFYNKKKKRNE